MTEEIAEEAKAPARRSRARTHEVEPAEGLARRVEVADLEGSLGPDADHARRIEVAHGCAERFAGRPLPVVLPPQYAQGVQRLAEWLKITGRGLDDLPTSEEIPAVVRYHWMLAAAAR